MHPARVVRSTRFARVAFFLAIGCMRGPMDCSCRCGDGGGDVFVEPPCVHDSECETTKRCYHTRCMPLEEFERHQACRNTAECRDSGACEPQLTRSFLGANSVPTCGAVRYEEDCRASRRCATHGRCAYGKTPGWYSDGVCAAGSEADCTKSKRCETHEECRLDRQDCVRDWSRCPPPNATPKGPAWATRSSGYDIPKSLGATWEPGALDDATVACEINAKHTGSSILRINDRCAPFAFLEPIVRNHVRLNLADSIAVSTQDDPSRGTSRSSFWRATYNGRSPFGGTDDGGSITCYVVPSAAVSGLAARELAKFDIQLAKARTKQPNGDRLQPFPPLEAARRSLSDAAVWIGWDAPQVMRRLAASEVVERTWNRALDRLFAQLWTTAGSSAAATGSNGIRVRPVALVCGDALQARYRARARPCRLPPCDKDRTIEPEQCGLEIVIENATEKAIGYDWSGLGPSWLRPSRTASQPGDAEIVDALFIDRRPVEPGSKPDDLRELATGEQAIFLVSGLEHDLWLGKGRPDERALFRVNQFLGKAFAIRTDLDPAKPSSP